MNKNTDVTQILKNLSDLKFCDEGDNVFWDGFLENIAALSKSDIAILISKEDQNWSIKKEYIDSEFNSETKNDILPLTISPSNRALENMYGYERFKENYYIVSIALDNIDDKEYVVVLLIENSDKKEFSSIIIRSALCRDIPLSYELLKQEIPNEIEENKALDIVHKTQMSTESYFEDILSLLNSIMYEKQFSLAAMKIVDELSNRFNCNKVSFGWEKHDYIDTVAINQVERFAKSAATIKSLEAIFEESYEQDEEIFYPEDENSTLITHAHKIYLKENRINALYTFPIRVDDVVVGVISFEKKEDTLSLQELEIIRLSLNYIAPTLKKIYYADRNIFKKSVDFVQNSSSTILGPKNTIKKLAVILSSILIAWIVFGKLEYKVEAVANLQTDNISYISAPFDGVVNDVKIDVGDSVKTNQNLLNFDIQELSLKKLEINSDIIRYDTEAEKARASRKLADMKISLAKKEQSLSSLKKIEYYLNQASIQAPFDGIIVEGDKEKLLGSPFSKGDIILQIANPVDLYGKIKVLEEYIDEIKVGQTAKLNLLSRPDIYFDVKIEKIIPMAKVDDVNGNIFTIKVSFLDPTQDWMRPGMSGIAKIQIEDRSVLWIITHKISDYFHMNIWW